MQFVREEIGRIHAALVACGVTSPELYAARQALEWVLEPDGVQPPYEMITRDKSAAREGCSARRRPPQF